MSKEGVSACLAEVTEQLCSKLENSRAHHHYAVNMLRILGVLVIVFTFRK